MTSPTPRKTRDAPKRCYSCHLAEEKGHADDCKAAKYKRLSASPYFEEMNRDRRECVTFLRSDLYRLDPDSADYDCVDRWRYVNPPGTLKVTLSFGERNLLGHVAREDGTLVSATTHATVDWLDEVLP